MLISTFEERAAKFVIEENLFVPSKDYVKEEEQETYFDIYYYSKRYEKTLEFRMRGKNNIAFSVLANNWDDLFEKALKVLKGYGKKSEYNKKDKPVKEFVQEFNLTEGE